jgi:hypothetical protein
MARTHMICCACNTAQRYTALTSRMGGSAVLLLLSLSVALPAVAQGGADQRSGNFVMGPDEKIGRADLAAPQRQAALAVAAKLQAVLTSDPAIAHPVGFSVRLQRAYGRRTDWADYDSGLPYYAGVFGTLFEAQATPSATHFGNPEFGVYANTVLQCPMQEFSPPLADGASWKLGNLPVLQGGRRTGEIQGYPIYDGQCVIISRSKEPAFRPLTREEYLRLELANLKGKMDKVRQQLAEPSLDASMHDAIASVEKPLQEAITQHEQEIASMDAETRRSPAAVQTGYQQADLVGVETEGAVPLSVPNPAFLDHSLPANQIQVVSVFLPFVQSGDRAAGLPAGLAADWQPAVEQIRDGLDWNGLGTLVR